MHHNSLFLYSAGNGQCLEDQPDPSLTQADPTALPGLVFDADAQCRAQLGPTAVGCPFGMDVSCFVKLGNIALQLTCLYI